LFKKKQWNYSAESSVDPPNPTQSFQRQQKEEVKNLVYTCQHLFKRKVRTDNWYSIGVCCCRIKKCTAKVNFMDYVKMASKSW